MKKQKKQLIRVTPAIALKGALPATGGDVCLRVPDPDNPDGFRDLDWYHDDAGIITDDRDLWLYEYSDGSGHPDHGPATLGLEDPVSLKAIEDHKKNPVANPHTVTTDFRLRKLH